ncbi:hypothetical protein HBI82_047110 [Parastagonospora nodorum]|nr:hypothetical protein HBI82_047110 [Parastagonospora nodorum]
MPRARVPNASFIASAELPLLPFLAPRVFTEPLLSRRSERPNGKSSRPQKEKAEVGKLNYGLKENDNRLPPKRGSDTLCTSTQCGNGSTAGGLLGFVLSRPASSNSTFSPASVERRYAEISSFARQFVRGYSSGRATRGATSRGGTSIQKASDTAAARKASTLYRRGPRLATRRERILSLQRERLANYVAHEIDQRRSSLMKQGQYRSLRRRIMNLEHWDDTQINLQGRQGGKRNRLVMTRALAALDRSLYPAIGQYTRKIDVKHDPMCARWSARVFPKAAKQDLEETWDNWMALDGKTRQSIYKSLLVYLLHRKPARAMQFIQVLASDRLLRARKADVIADALGHLAKLHSRDVYDARHEWSTDKRAVKRKFVSDFVHVFHQVLAARPRVCSQDLLYNLVSVAEAKDLQKVLTCFLENRTYLGFDTLLHYANAFAKAGDVRSALRCLEELKAVNSSTTWETMSDRERLRWSCALILRKSMSKGHEYHETPAIVEAIVRLGITMDLLLYNVVMHNAMEAHDYSTAFKVYNTLEGNGLKADKHTYSILLHGCTLQDNPAMFSQFAEHCADVAEEIRDPWLATDYLHYVYVRHHDHSDRAQTLASLQRAYLRLFSARPLDLLTSRVIRTLSAPPGTEHGPSEAPKLDPPSMAVYIMYQAQIQEALTGSPRQMEDMYARFKYIVQQDIDPALTRLANDAIIWNAFLLAFCSKQQFASASQLIKDMAEHSTQPNIYTWNIFMQAFFKTGQVQAAERVFEILRSRGIDPDQFTYGVMLRGYAKAQRVDRIGEIMQHLNADQEMEPDLLRALAGITQRNKLMLTLERSRVYKEVQAQEKTRLEAEDEEQRWTAPQLGDVESPADVVEREIQSFASDVASGAEAMSLLWSRESEMNSKDLPAIQAESSYSAKPTEAPASADKQGVPVTQEYGVEHLPEMEATHLIRQQPSTETESAVKSQSGDKLDPVVMPEPPSKTQLPTKPASVAKPIPTPTVKATSSKQKPINTRSRPARTPQPRPENALDPDVQYKKLQEKLGILAPPSPSPSSDVQPTPSPNTSFGADLGYKSSQVSKSLPEFTLRRMYPSTRQRGGKE